MHLHVHDFNVLSNGMGFWDGHVNSPPRPRLFALACALFANQHALTRHRGSLILINITLCPTIYARVVVVAVLMAKVPLMLLL